MMGSSAFLIVGQVGSKGYGSNFGRVTIKAAWSRIKGGLAGDMGQPGLVEFMDDGHRCPGLPVSGISAAVRVS
jgi:hypothetical protein